MTPDLYTANMTDAQRATFYAEYQLIRKDEIVAILLAFFLGSFGAHHFYLKRNGLGIFYCCLFWTGVPGLVAIVECFFMPGRVREFNAMQAVTLASTILAGVPASGAGFTLAQPVICAACGQPLESSALFCTRCGASLAVAG